MSMTVGNLTFDCADPGVVATFWSQVMNLEIADGASEFFVMAGPADPAALPKWLFLKVPEAKSAKNRLHIDISSDDPEADNQRLLELGAIKVGDCDEWGHKWSVYADPEGNEFCMSGPHANAVS